ncbi:hypothetical protein [Lysobacter sp. Root667]|uniref:hypothetical protein n=1 Tax=Lysobacter sp. Root667 TaxID=1736581 RepID=UPI000B084CE3|nr:hypothetical protein [Lysobacter sp. Root667]
MYGNTWASQFGVAATGVAAQTWGAALAGLGPDQLAEGLRACVAEGREFPPNAPRFRAMCFGIPSIERVQLDLRKPDTASRFARAVWMHVDGYAYRSADGRGQDRQLRAAYDVVHAAVMAGGALPLAPAANLEAPKPRAPIVTPGVAERSMAAIRGILAPTAEERAAEVARLQAEEERRVLRERARAELGLSASESGYLDDAELARVME